MNEYDIPDDPARTAGFGELESDQPFVDPLDAEPDDTFGLFVQMTRERPIYVGDAFALTREQWYAINATQLRNWWHKCIQWEERDDDERHYLSWCSIQYELQRVWP
jgi:hypothetical protein